MTKIVQPRVKNGDSYDDLVINVANNSVENTGNISSNLQALAQANQKWEDFNVYTTDSVPSGLFHKYYSIVYGNGMYVCVDTVGSERSLYYCTDRLTWISALANKVLNLDDEVIFANGKFFASNSTGLPQYSVDGINWNVGVSTESIAGIYGCPTYVNGVYIASEHQYSTSENAKLIYSTDGVNWNVATINREEPTNHTERWLRAVYSKEVYTYFIVDYNNNVTLYSNNGKSWTALDENFKMVGNFISDGEAILAIGDSTFNVYPPPGQESSSDTTTNGFDISRIERFGIKTQLYSMPYGYALGVFRLKDGDIVALTTEGAFLKTSTSSDWTKVSDILFRNCILWDVSETESYIVATYQKTDAQTSAYIAYSKDGITWNTYPKEVGYGLSKIGNMCVSYYYNQKSLQTNTLVLTWATHPNIWHTVDVLGSYNNLDFSSPALANNKYGGNFVYSDKEYEKTCYWYITSTSDIPETLDFTIAKN